MGDVWKSYTKEMAQRFSYLAAWTPGAELKLGDVGVLRDNLFTRLTTLSLLGISFQERTDQTPEDIHYATSGSSIFAFKAAGTAPAAGSALTAAKAGVSIQFTKDRAVILEALECRTPSIEDQLALGQEILRRYRAGTWNQDWVVITELVTATSGTVLISETKGAQMEISASGDVARGNFSIANAGLGLTIMSQQSMAVTLIAKQGLTPLFRCRGIKSRDAVSVPMLARGIRPTDLGVPADPQRSERLYFGELRFDYRSAE